MIKQIKQQQPGNVNDSCADCGSFVDIGAVVEADDTLLQLTFNGEDALTKANALEQIALQRFPETKAEIKQLVNQCELTLNFAFSVEKMIFQLENSL
ncbi:DUF406 family protein [Shewanella ulleungensis]|jgi:uncharacterized protein YfcZ (UPF0381/DUF406 family)|uniref:DUF406 family protein n=1 Tax=Shewanella ulleungensis TaxID=2282699 RepID=A0ABQ2QFB9_9GAMM|nr:DUF406 family protein [Shewanella ulleungensis]MCL1148620.1 YfcZ/YiiS family protein [Shewanella ulleungensis]GGP76702.1 hypothetical protein GCM10009410_06460 [Shewanella ulleungensis]